MKKPNTLNYPNSILEILAMCEKKTLKLSVKKKHLENVIRKLLKASDKEPSRLQETIRKLRGGSQGTSWTLKGPWHGDFGVAG